MRKDGSVPNDGTRRNEIEETSRGAEDRPSIEKVLSEIAQAHEHLALFFQAAKNGRLTESDIREIVWAVHHLLVAAAGESILLNHQNGGWNERELRRLYG